MTLPRRLAGLLILVLAAACGSTPLAPTPAQTPPNTSRFELRGTVRYTTFGECVGCAVAIIDGPGTGAATTTDRFGNFVLQVAEAFAPLTVRASHDGYVPATVPVTEVSNHAAPPVAMVNIRLRSVTPSHDLAGTYDVVFEAAAACTTLPPAARRRAYVVTVQPQATEPDVHFWARPVDGITAPIHSFALWLGVSGHSVAVSVDTEWTDGIVEEFAPGEFLQISGSVAPHDPVNPRHIAAPFGGEFTTCATGPLGGGRPYRCPRATGYCPSTMHRLTMTPR